MVTHSTVQRDMKLICGLQQRETNAVENTVPLLSYSHPDSL
jgi:hypothetical protein